MSKCTDWSYQEFADWMFCRHLVVISGSTLAKYCIINIWSVALPSANTFISTGLMMFLLFLQVWLSKIFEAAWQMVAGFVVVVVSVSILELLTTIAIYRGTFTMFFLFGSNFSLLQLLQNNGLELSPQLRKLGCVLY